MNSLMTSSAVNLTIPSCQQKQAEKKAGKKDLDSQMLIVLISLLSGHATKF